MQAQLRNLHQYSRNQEVIYKFEGEDYADKMEVSKLTYSF